MMHWLYLLAAGLMEVAWAYGLSRSQGFTRPLASVLTVIGMAASFYLLARALRTLPLGTAYAVWTGVGAVGTALVGILFLGEGVSAPRLFFLGLIVCGIVGLKLVSPH